MELGGEVGKLSVPIPPPRETPVPPKKLKDIPENAVIRTNKKLDKTIEHLGYQSMSFSPEELVGLGRTLPRDVDIVDEAQRRLKQTEIIPDSKLAPQQLTHLNLARAVAREGLPHNPVLVYAAIIPPASDRVRTVGMYGTTTGTIYISLEMLPRCRSTVDTLVHELGHHEQHLKGEAEDLTPAHAEAMTEIAAKVVKEVGQGTFDKLLKEVSW